MLLNSDHVQKKITRNKTCVLGFVSDFNRSHALLTVEITINGARKQLSKK